MGAALLFTGLFFAGSELLRFAEFLQKGESVMVVAQLILFTIPGVMTFTFPMAMLLATLLGFGRLSSDSEVVAFTAAGCSFERAVVPVAVMGLTVALVGLWFNNTVVPTASRERNVIINRFKSKGGNVTGSKITVPIRDGDGNLTMMIHVEGSADLGTGELTNVSLDIWQSGHRVGSLYAPRAVWQGTTDRKNDKNWLLYNVEAAYWKPNGVSVTTAKQAQTKEIPIDTPDNLKAYLDDRRPEDIETGELMENARIRREGGDISKAREFEVEVARRNSVPFAAFAFGLVGAALGVRSPREGRGVGFGLSVVITFFYYVSLNVTSILARNGSLPANFALMLPNLIGFAAGIFLIRRVMR